MLFPGTKYERTGRGITLIHQYKNNGYNIVLDVCSGAVHVLDDLCYDVLEVLLTEEPGKDYTAEELESAGVQALVQEKLAGRYPEEELSEEDNIFDAVNNVQSVLGDKDAGIKIQN